MAEQIRVILPKKYDLVVGDTFQLFYRGVIEAPNPYVYAIVAICDKGRNFPRYFEYTPTEPGQHKLTIKVYDAQRNLLGEADTILNVVVPKEPENTTNILCVGDSLTGGGWPHEAFRRITQEGGEPAGLGYTNAVKFVGSCRNENRYPGIAAEGRSGYTWNNFLYSLPGGLHVECANRRGFGDLNSLWQDCNGAIWRLTGLKIDYLSFRPYEDHNSPIPAHGPLTHISGAEDTSPIEFNYSFTSEYGSPFINPEPKPVDIADYCKRTDIDRIDVVYFFLGTNGLMSTEANTTPREEYCWSVVNKGKELVAHFKKAFPDIKVKIMGIPLWSINGGIGQSYGAILPLTDRYELTYYKMQLNKTYQQWCLEDEYKDFCEFINISGQFDSEYNFPSMEVPVNTRSTITERRDTNPCHPSPNGYKQIGDAVYRNIVASFCCE